MGKLFGYPEFDINGEEILCTYDNEYSEMMMDVRVYRMKAGEKRDFCRKGEEIAVLLLSGKINFACEDISETVSRESVFTEGPFAVHSCSDCNISVVAQEDSEILVQCTKNSSSFAPKLYRPEDAPWGYSCLGKFN